MWSHPDLSRPSSSFLLANAGFQDFVPRILFVTTLYSNTTGVPLDIVQTVLCMLINSELGFWSYYHLGSEQSGRTGVVPYGQYRVARPLRGIAGALLCEAGITGAPTMHAWYRSSGPKIDPLHTVQFEWSKQECDRIA